MAEQQHAQILVVDDEEPIRELLTRILGDEGYGVDVAGNVEEALDSLAAGSTDLILLDLHMPGPYDGEELLFLLRDRGDEVPIIIVSGWVDDEAAMSHPECVHAVLKKPIHSSALIEAVRQALGPG